MSLKTAYANREHDELHYGDPHFVGLPARNCYLYLLCKPPVGDLLIKPKHFNSVSAILTLSSVPLFVDDIVQR